MGIQDLQALLESTSLEGGAVSVDLLKIARNVTQRQQPHNSGRKIRPIGNKLKLIVDAEDCLDRLYGGYFSDWACGGQWNRMVQFLSLLTQAVERGNIELAVVFNGTIESSRMSEWVAQQANVRQRVGMVLKHVNTKATPPPKVWWTAPICLKTALRMALRHLGITVMCTMDDHHQEVIAYCREYGFHGLLADDAEYAAFNPPRYFSSENIKLTYKGSLETKEYMVAELSKHLQLTQEQMCVLASLLGNFLLPENELQDVYKKIQTVFINKDTKMQGESAVRLIAMYVRTLPSPSNMDALVTEVFGSNKDKRCPIFKQSVLYYLNGTAHGFLKYSSPKANNYKGKKATVQNNNNVNSIKTETELDTAGFASETTEQEQESLQNYRLATVNQVLSSDIISPETDSSAKSSPHVNFVLDESSPTSDSRLHNGHASAGSSSNSSSTSGTGNSNNNTATTGSLPSPRSNTISGNVINPTVSTDVLRTSSLRHQKGLMCPWILHVLSTREIRLPCVMEDEGNREFPPIHEIYLPLRQRIYAVLFNLHHYRYVQTKGKKNFIIPDCMPTPEIVITEWVYSRSNPYQTPEQVKAVPLSWAVPTLQRLWFGPSVDDKRRRMRALLSCLNSDTPLILNMSYVPQHMLVMACVLRYIMSQDKPILRRNELDVFICQAFNPDLMNTQYLQELTLNVVTSRGVQLAAVFMNGVEMALLANDACGAPLPWLLCCPWLYFDGKLFHHTLTRSIHAKSLLDLCENHIERVVKVERMRKAILEGLDAKFAKIPLQVNAFRMPPSNCLPPVPLPSSRGPSNMRHRPLQSRGAQLQIAGVVVGSWGANYGYQQQNLRQPPQMVSGVPFRGGLNPQNRGLPAPGNNFMPPQQQYNHRNNGSNPNRQRKQGPPTFNVNKKNNPNKKKSNKQKQNAGGANKGRNNNALPFTTKTDIGDVLVSDVIKKEHSLAEEAILEDCRGGSEHQGQGDGPSIETAAC